MVTRIFNLHLKNRTHNGKGNRFKRDNNRARITIFILVAAIHLSINYTALLLSISARGISGAYIMILTVQCAKW